MYIVKKRAIAGGRALRGGALLWFVPARLRARPLLARPQGRRSRAPKTKAPPKAGRRKQLGLAPSLFPQCPPKLLCGVERWLGSTASCSAATTVGRKERGVEARKGWSHKLSRGLTTAELAIDLDMGGPSSTDY